MSDQESRPPAEIDFLRLPDVKKRTGMSRATIYRRIAAGEFPRPHKNGSITFWPSNDVRDWQIRQLVG